MDMIYTDLNDPLVVRVMNEFKMQIFVREQAQMQEMARRWLQLENALGADISALTYEIEQLRREVGTVKPWRIYRLSRHKALLAQLKQQTDLYNQYAERLITAQQLELAGLGIEHGSQAISAQAINLYFDRLPIDALQNMIGLAGDGSPLSDLLQQSWPDAADGMTLNLLKGVTLGWNPNKTARAMKDGMANGLNRALNIARTEQIRVYREASRQQYELSGVVSGFKRLAARNTRTCLACLMADGEVYQLREQLRDHPSGRCTMVPNVIGVRSPKWQSGRKWFMEQDEETQRSMMGPGRYDAWKEGQFKLQDLVTVRQNATWGDSVQPTPLKQLTA